MIFLFNKILNLSNVNFYNNYKNFFLRYKSLYCNNNISIYPVFFIIGNAVLNTGIIILDIVFYNRNFLIKKNILFLKIIYFIHWFALVGFCYLTYFLVLIL